MNRRFWEYSGLVCSGAMPRFGAGGFLQPVVLLRYRRSAQGLQFTFRSFEVAHGEMELEMILSELLNTEGRTYKGHREPSKKATHTLGYSYRTGAVNLPKKKTFQGIPL